MAKTPPRAPVDYEGLWNTYSRWQQEDLNRYEYQKEKYGVTESGYTAAEGAERARLASTGVEVDSDLFNERIANIRKDIPDFEAEYAQSQQELKDSSMYDQLFISDAAENPVRRELAITQAEGQNAQGDVTIYNKIGSPEEIQQAREDKYDELFGTPDVANMYSPSEEQMIRNDSADRAKAASSGRKSPGRGGGNTEDETSPWI